MRHYFHSQLLQPGAEPRASSSAVAPPFCLFKFSCCCMAFYHAFLCLLNRCGVIFIVRCCNLEPSHVRTRQLMRRHFFLVQLLVHGGLPCISTCADLLQRFIVSCCYMALQHVSWSSAVATWRLAMCFYVSWFVATLFFQVSYCDIAFQHVTNSADAPPCCFLKFSCLKKAGDSAVLCQLKLCWSSAVATWFLTTCFYFS